LAFTPAGLGIYDFGWYGALKLAGVPDSEIIPFVLGQRAFITIFTLLFTFTAFSLKQIHSKINFNLIK